MQHDRAYMVEFVRKTPPKFRKYYIHMQAANEIDLKVREAEKAIGT